MFSAHETTEKSPFPHPRYCGGFLLQTGFLFSFCFKIMNSNLGVRVECLSPIFQVANLEKFYNLRFFVCI